MPVRTLADLSPDERTTLESRLASVVDAVKLEIAAAVVRGDRIGARLLKRVRLPPDQLQARARGYVEAVASGPASSVLRDVAAEFARAPSRRPSARETLFRARAAKARPAPSPTARTTPTLVANSLSSTWKPWRDPVDAPQVSERFAILKLRRMKCVARTRRLGEIENGADEMYVLGVKYDAGAVESAKVQPVDLGSWEDGKSRDYGTGGKKILAVQFLRNQPFPTQAAAILTFAERDPNGGMFDFLDDLWSAVKDLAAEEMEEWLDERNDKPAEGGTPTDTDKDDVWIAVLVQLVIQAVTQLIKWLKELTEDDIFGESTIGTSSPVLYSLDERWDADNRTAVERAYVTQYGGEYEVDYFWELSDRQ